jgi:hypothetical protein
MFQRPGLKQLLPMRMRNTSFHRVLVMQPRGTVDILILKVSFPQQERNAVTGVTIQTTGSAQCFMPRSLCTPFRLEPCWVKGSDNPSVQPEFRTHHIGTSWTRWHLPSLPTVVQRRWRQYMQRGHRLVGLSIRVSSSLLAHG